MRTMSFTFEIGDGFMRRNYYDEMNVRVGVDEEGDK